MANMPLFRGSAVALITPFDQGQVDIEALRRLVDFQIDNGTAAIITCGTTGEPATLTPDEREMVVRETVKAVNGRAPVICGTGSNCTQSVIDTEKRYRDLGCVAQLVVTPYYNKTTQEGLYAHFMAVAEHTRLPIVLYNVPSRTGLEIMPETLRRLGETGRFVALKESSYQLPLIMEKLDAMGDGMTLYSGNDDMVTPLMSLGAQGVISVAANPLPKLMSRLAAAHLEGRPEEALRRQIELLPFIRALFAEVSPIPCKYVMEKLGLCSGELRLPLIGAGQDVRDKLDAALKKLA